MGQGQIGQGLVGFESGVGLYVRFSHAQNVAVGDHGPLGTARGAGGIDDHGHVIGLDFRQAPLDAIGILLQIGPGASEEFVEKNDAFPGKTPESLGVPNDDFLDLEFGQDLQDLVHLFLVFDKQDLGFRVAHHVGHLVRSGGGIDPHRDAADGHVPQIAEEPFRTVLTQDGDLVAPFDPQRNQAGRHDADHLPVFFPGDAFPDAEILVAQGHPVLMAGHLAEKKAWKTAVLCGHYQRLLFLYRRQPLAESVWPPRPRYNSCTSSLLLSSSAVPLSTIRPASRM